MSEVPTARVERTRPLRWFWLIPLLAAVFAAGLIATYVIERGPIITIALPEGYGLEPGDVLRCRGIVVGEIEQTRLTEDLAGVEVMVRLEPDAANLARAGSRFWVVRPRLSITEIGGLETITGPKYLAVLPGEGDPQDRFIALEDPPIISDLETDGLEITLVAAARKSLRRGAPVLYRQVQVGVILSSGLSSDGASVEIQAYLFPRYADVVRTNTRFWNVSGVDFQVGLSGLTLEVESLQSILDGGVALATPDAPGPPVSTGHRFTLAPKAEDEWLAWKPALAIGYDLLPPDATRPTLLRATAERRDGPVWDRLQQYSGWLLRVEGGVVGPEKLTLTGDAKCFLEAAGRRFDLAALDSATWGPSGKLRLLEITLPADVGPPLPADRMRRMTQPEDVLLLTTLAARPIPLAAARLTRVNDGWAVEPAVSFSNTHHGAAVLAKSDGALVGLLVVEKGTGEIAPVPVGSN